MPLYFAVAEGRGSALKAHVMGPYNSVQDFDTKVLNVPHFGGTVAVVGNQNGYPNRLAAQQEVNKYNAGDVNQRVTQAGGNTAQSAGVDPTQLFHGLNLQNWIIRIGEIILGTVLVGVGLARLTGADNLISSALKVVK